MTPTKFDEHNVVFAEDQPEYQPLPALKTGNDKGEIITCWELSDEELEEVIKNKKVYLSQWTFDNALQPVMIHSSLDKFEKHPDKPAAKKYSYKTSRVYKKHVAPAGYIFLLVVFTHKKQEFTYRVACKAEGLTDELIAQLAEVGYNESIENLKKKDGEAK